MKETGLVSKQPGAHRYQAARSERPDIPNLLSREFDVQQSNQVCCFTPTKVANTVAGHFGNGCGAIV